MATNIMVAQATSNTSQIMFYHLSIILDFPIADRQEGKHHANPLHNLRLEVLSLSKAQVSSLQKLLEDFAARGVRLPARSAWVNDLPEMLRASSTAPPEKAKNEGT